jgi:uncharacterized protein
MGGGFLMIPLMTACRSANFLGLGISQHQAHGTSLFAVSATGLAGALAYSSLTGASTSSVQWPEALGVTIGGVVTARFGALLNAAMSARLLKQLLGTLMLLVAPTVPLKGYLASVENKPKTNGASQVNSIFEGDSHDINSLISFIGVHLGVPVCIGACSGFLAGLFGVGGGTIVVPALTLATDMSHTQALATSLAAMTFPAIAGVSTHYRAGNVAGRHIVLPLALGALVGAYSGGKFVKTYLADEHEQPLQYGFAGLLTYLGIRTLMRA